MHVLFRLALFVTLAAAAPTGTQQLASGPVGRGLQLRAEFYNIFDINQWIAVHTIARFRTMF